LHSAPQPTAPPPFCEALGLETLPDATLLGINPNFIACTPTEPAVGPKSSGATSITYNFQNSAIGLTSPASLPAAGPVTFAGALSTTPPDGSQLSTPVTNGSTGGTGASSGTASGTVYLCGSGSNTIASLGGQPASCAAFYNNGTPPAGWTCVKSTTGGLGIDGPTLTLPDQGLSGTYYAFSCKDGMTWSAPAAGFPVTVAPYVHTPTFVMTGAPSDFFAAETLPVSNGATAYVTFDQSPGNLYIGFDKGSTIASTDIIHFYVGTASGGTSTPDSVAAGTFGAANLPLGFNALYHVYWYADTWAADGDPAAVKFNGSTFVEFSIPISALAGTNNDLHLLGADWTGSLQAGAWPAPNPNTIAAGVTPAWTSWQGEDLASGWSPNDAVLLDRP
jgi:hypothetical protein